MEEMNFKTDYRKSKIWLEGREEKTSNSLV